MFQKFLVVTIGFLMLQCSRKEMPAPSLPFESKPVTVPLQPGLIDEVSGITAASTVPGSIWAQQDGGNTAEIILMNEKAMIQKRIFIKAAFNRD